jgi:predicted ATPase
MKIIAFQIQNYRNIRLAEATAPPDFMVICGGNGSGKSAVLNALMTAKEHAGAYGHFEFDPRAVSADAASATISLTLAFSDAERQFVQRQFGTECPATDSIEIEIKKGGQGRAQKRSPAVKQLLSWYSRSYLDSPGFFDYIDAHRSVPKVQLSTWDASFLSDERAKGTLGATGAAKFQNTKAYLAGLVMRDIQAAQAAHRAGRAEFPDSLRPIREFFDGFFAPMRFADVLIHKSPFEFIVETPRGIIDLDDLSAGEKEVLNTFIRFHQLNPRGAVILFDEADAHLHPDLERRYLQVLRDIGRGNQLWLTTHSPEMMIAAGADSLFTVLKSPPPGGGTQFTRVSSTEELHASLSELMGSRGLVSFNQRIIFIEGEEASADREVYERLYPPNAYHVSFVPAGNSSVVRKTAERVNDLLSASMSFQYFYSIVDGDIARALPAPEAPTGPRLYQLPVYHVENLLLDDDAILATVSDMLGAASPFRSTGDVAAALRALVLADCHVKPYAKALHDARVARAAKAAWDAVFRRDGSVTTSVPAFDQTEQDARALLADSLQEGTWRARCKGREVLRGFCADLGLNYVHARNVIISKLGAPPPALAAIMNRILA